MIEIHPCHFHHPVFDTPMMHAKILNDDDDDDDDINATSAICQINFPQVFHYLVLTVCFTISFSALYEQKEGLICVPDKKIITFLCRCTCAVLRVLFRKLVG